MRSVQVVAHHAWDTVEPLRAELDALNLASRRPCPFATFEYLRALDAHDEYRRPGDQLLFLAALEAGKLVGYLPLRRRRHRILGVGLAHLGVLADHDTDRPHVVAAAEDEAGCSEAFYRHLVEREPGWAVLELLFQDEASALARPPALPPGRFHVRHFENMPNTTVPLPFATLEAYFRSLSSSHRNSVARFARRLFKEGRVEVLWSGDAAGRRPLLDLYLDVERRSWKAAAGAGVGRDPRRVAFFRELCGPEHPLRLHFDLLLLDGLPIAGMFGGAFAGGFFALETTFDEAYDRFSPGQLLWLMAFAQAIKQGAHSYNLDGNYAYYKQRWGGVVTPTAALQIYRVGTLPWLKARGGELRRRLWPAAAAPELSNPERQRAVRGEDGTGEPAAPPARPDRAPERERARQALGALEAGGARLDRLAGADLEAVLPFQTRTREP